MPINFLDFILSQNPTEEERQLLSQECARRAATLFEECNHWMDAASCWIAAGESERAIEIYLKESGYRQAAQLLLSNGRYQEAIDCYQKCFETMNQNDIEANVSLRLGMSACLKLMKQDIKKAKKLYKEARLLI